MEDVALMSQIIFRPFDKCLVFVSEMYFDHIIMMKFALVTMFIFVFIALKQYVLGSY